MDFVLEAKKFGISITESMLEKFDKYYEMLIEINQYMNLTAITEKEEVFNKHFLDSLTIGKAMDLSSPVRLCDVGSGAGFPAIPLAIVCENIEITIIDALNKRIKFLKDVIQTLNLKKVSAYHKRAEEYGFEARETFDIVTARAVARLNILAELCLPLTKIGGYFIAMKGQSALEELSESKKGIQLLGGEVVNCLEFNLPDEAGKRMIILIKKVKETPKKYPRAYAKIKEKPL